MKIAVIGASGFIGLRACEKLLLDAYDEIVPIVRAYSSLAVLARHNYPAGWRVASFFEPKELGQALKGCDACIHVAIGNAAQIPAMAKTVYQACAIAGVRRLVWMSSSSVHGQNPSPDVDADTPLRNDHPLLYNNAKVRAEWALEKLQRDHRVGVVRLRPSVVYGPRSRWLTDFATRLLSGHLGWIDQGRAICNTIYVDNLVDAARLACEAPNALGKGFFVGDAESVTWKDFLMPIVQCYGLDQDALVDVPVPTFPPEKENRVDAIKLSTPYAAVSNRVPPLARRLVKAAAASWPAPIRRSAHRLPDPPAVSMTHEVALLQQCRWQLPNQLAMEQLGYHPAVSFQTGMERSIDWLKFLELDAFSESRSGIF